ncbi:5-formyltetrahydrofolate cyclo-ligase [Nitrincola alkalilacustris]|uniref:5-formyltetrahydrofolate cyclo-ligase n=1 Tax=Nitrincola alkalilacustris TaxID=1571224 RepID=UPI00124E9E2F|nr:5-formyltetrahydrofolate cyclo-ligase [Nitrincola alkalilacustris]
MDARRELRKQMRAKRRNLTPQQQLRASERAMRTLQNQLWFRQAQHIALYLPNDGEIDPTAMIKLCWKLRKTVLLPVLHPISHNCLWFLPYKPSTRMRRNSYKILEPVVTRARRRPAWALDLVMMPLVAFDPQGGRLGMGGGYYDRTFSFKFNHKGMKGPRLIGLAHDFQKVEKLPTAAWDVPLQGILTDGEFYPVSG